MTYESERVFTFAKADITFADARAWAELFTEDAKHQLKDKVNYAISFNSTTTTIIIDITTKSGRHVAKLFDELSARIVSAEKYKTEMEARI